MRILKIIFLVSIITLIACGNDMENFKPVHLKRTHEIELNGKVENIFKLFTAEGEKFWAEGWDPEFYYPENETTVEGAVFVTSSHENKQTVWTCVVFDESSWHVKYVRIIINVKCSSSGENKTKAEVTYEFTSLSEEGNVFVKSFTDEHYEKFIDSWEVEINNYLKTKQN